MNFCMTGNFDLNQTGKTILTNAQHLDILASRWVFGRSGSGSGIDMSLSDDVPDCRSAKSFRAEFNTPISPAPLEESHIRYAIEGRQGILGIADRVCSLKFKVKTNRPGMHAVVFVKPYADLSNVDTFVAPYLVEQADTWETKRIVIDLSKSQNRTWHKGNGIGLRFRFAYYAGSQYSAPPGWNSGNFVSAAGAVNLAAQAGSYHQISQVDFYVGDFDRDFEPMPIEDVLASVQRYECIIGCSREDSVGLSGFADQPGQTAYQTINYPTTMRANPSVIAATFQTANCGQPEFLAGVNSMTMRIKALAAGRFAARSDTNPIPILLRSEL